jgi:hypothetical protein
VALGALRDRAGDRVAAEVAEAGVERLVEDVERLEVAGVARAVLGVDHRPQLGDVVVGGALGGEADGGALQRLAHELRVAHAADGDRGDERAALRRDLDELLVAQADQRLADRGAGDAELARQLVLGQPCARRQLHGDDGLAQRRVRPGTGGLVGEPPERGQRDDLASGHVD